jgi:dihydrofolate synthase/folylpolyglutamate synthase
LKNIKKNISKNSSSKFIFGKDYKYKKINNGFIYKDKKGEINLPYPNLLGDFQISNVSTAIGTIRNLNQFKIKESHIRDAITKIRSEGRLQFIKEGKLRKYVSNNNKILIDGAHNPLAAKVIEKYLGSLNSRRKIIMLLGMMANKDHKGFIQVFKNRVQSIITLDIPNQVNFINKEKLSKIAKSCGITSKAENSIELALKKISKENNNAIIFCTGSLYFAGEILNLN